MEILLIDSVYSLISLVRFEVPAQKVNFFIKIDNTYYVLNLILYFSNIRFVHTPKNPPSNENILSSRFQPWPNAKDRSFMRIFQTSIHTLSS